MQARLQARSEQRFWTLAKPLLTQAGVTRSTMMGFPCLRLDGDFFASCDPRSGDLVVKLTEDRATALIDAGRAEPFAPNGRRFREWASISQHRHRSWPTLLEEAMRASIARQSIKRSPKGTPADRNRRTERTGQRALERVRGIALEFPEVSERLSHGEPCFFVREKRPLCYFHDNHNGDGRISLWCPVPPGVQQELVSTEPERFFAPATSARGVFADWVGMYLDTAGKHRVDWEEVAALIEDAFRTVAPKTLVAELDQMLISKN